MLHLFGVKGRVWAAACVVAMTAVASAAPVLPKSGTYLSSTYIATLKKTKSHFKAVGASADPQAVYILNETDGNSEGNFILDAAVDFSYMALATHDPKEPTYYFEDPYASGKKPYIWVDATHFKIGHGKHQTTYTYVGDGQEFGGEQKFLIATMLAGTYRDARGRQYVFGADGKAQFPDRTFTVQILTNVLDESWDQIIEHGGENEGDRFAFAWHGKTLTLYNCDPDADSIGCTPDRKHPIAVLHKAK